MSSQERWCLMRVVGAAGVGAGRLNAVAPKMSARRTLSEVGLHRGIDFVATQSSNPTLARRDRRRHGVPLAGTRGENGDLERLLDDGTSAPAVRAEGTGADPTHAA